MTSEWQLEEDEDPEAESEFRVALKAGRFDEARALVEQRVTEAGSQDWFVTSMLEDLGLSLARAGRHDDAIASFERALELGWDVVPDGRCEIARVLLLAGRHAEADVLWAELRANDPDGMWTLSAGGMAYGEVGRDEEAIEWLGEGLRVAIDRDDPEHIVDQMSDERRVSLRRLGCELDELEHEVEAFRARAAVRRDDELTEMRAEARRAGIPVRGRPITVAWLTEEGFEAARQRWPGWVDGLNHLESFDQYRARMERALREHRADGDGPFVVVMIDLERYAAWCEEQGYEPVDRRSRASFAELEREQRRGRSWPPGRNELCWCGTGRKYKRCCGALSMTSAVGRAGAGRAERIHAAGCDRGDG